MLIEIQAKSFFFSGFILLVFRARLKMEINIFFLQVLTVRFYLKIFSVFLISSARSFSSLTIYKLHLEIEGKSDGNGEYDSSLNPRRCDQQTGGRPSQSRVTKDDFLNG